MSDWPTTTHDRLLRSAATDLVRNDEIVPTFVAHDGEEELFTAGLRPFAPGEYHDPLIELAALALPLGANRLVLSMAGRAWSLDDPMPPVSAAADLRQRVVIVTCADGSSGASQVWSTLHPFELERPGGGTPGRPALRWGQPRTLEGGEGWISEALAALVVCPPMSSVREEIRRQAVRVRNLGHELVLRPQVRARLRSSRAARR